MHIQNRSDYSGINYNTCVIHPKGEHIRFDSVLTVFLLLTCIKIPAISIKSPGNVKKKSISAVIIADHIAELSNVPNKIIRPIVFKIASHTIKPHFAPLAQKEQNDSSGETGFSQLVQNRVFLITLILLNFVKINIS